MKFGHIPEGALEMFIHNAPESIWNKDWLIVAWDSSRGVDLKRSYNYLKKQMLSPEWLDNGIRFSGDAFRKFAALKENLVPFTAVFILEKDAPSPEPVYNLTSEAETFKTHLPTELEENLKMPGVLAYLADGCGLNYAISNNFDLNL